MKKLVLFFCAVVFLSGCASMTISQVTSRNRESLAKLYVGLPRSNALEIMGKNPITLNCPDVSSKHAKQVTIANPYRTETLQNADRKFEVAYYAIDISNDCLVSEDGLIALVFENDKLIGWGKEFLQGINKK